MARKPRPRLAVALSLLVPGQLVTVPAVGARVECRPAVARLLVDDLVQRGVLRPLAPVWMGTPAPPPLAYTVDTTMLRLAREWWCSPKESR